MPEQMIGQNNRHHRFADGDGADADARVVRPLVMISVSVMCLSTV